MGEKLSKSPPPSSKSKRKSGKHKHKKRHSKHTGSKVKRLSRAEKEEQWSQAAEKLLKAREEEFGKFRVSVFGVVDSGRNTFVKQMKVCFAEGYSLKEKQRYREDIQESIQESAVCLIRYAWDMQDDLKISDSEREELNDFYYRFKDGLKPEAISAFSRIWGRSWMQKFFECSASCLGIPESYVYFFDKAVDILFEAESYLPCEKDIVVLKEPTSKELLTEYILVEGRKMTITIPPADIPDRKNWGILFGNLNAIIITVPVSDYDQYLDEDEKSNVLKESLAVWELAIGRYVLPTHTVNAYLVFTKTDVFREKIRRVPLTVCFPEYLGKSTFEEASKYILKKFNEAKTDKLSPGIHHKGTYWLNTLQSESCSEIMKQISGEMKENLGSSKDLGGSGKRLGSSLGSFKTLGSFGRSAASPTGPAKHLSI